MPSAFARLLSEQLSDELGRLRRGRRPGAAAEKCVNIAELRELARRTIPASVFDYIDGGANDERTLRRNTLDFSDLEISPRVLVDVSSIDLSTTVLGQPVAVPILGAPTGLTGLAHPLGEVGVARAVHAAGSIYTLSASSSYTIEEVAERAPGPTWFQLYMWRDRGFVRELLERARAAGHRALVLTVDVPVSAGRERDIRNGFGIPPRVSVRTIRQGLARPGWSVRFLRDPRIEIANASGLPQGEGARSMVEFVNRQFDASASWNDIAWLREVWDGPVAIKGILRPDDAEQGVRAGASAIVVSNHGGRQLDGAPSAIAALPGIVAAVGGDAEVLLDSGVRRGSDVLKALALGARACLVGRAAVFGLAAGGQPGAERAMKLLVDELRTAMALAGLPRVADVDASCLVGRMPAEERTAP
jgi:L-lactate dehydrogenase (cytochrome)